MKRAAPNSSARRVFPSKKSENFVAAQIKFFFARVILLKIQLFQEGEKNAKNYV